MNREDLEHIIRASADVTQQYEFIIVGSQSLLGPVPYPEDVFKMSAEADIYPFNAPELADAIDGAIGEGSRFHELNGYYAQGVGPDTATLAEGWMDRLHRVQNANTNGRVGYCLDTVDLFLAKAAAAREKDRIFCVALLEHGHVTLHDALALVPRMPLSDEEKKRLKARIQRWVKEVAMPIAATKRNT